MRLNEARHTAKGLPDLMPYDSLVADGVMLLQDGSLLAAWRFRGPDMASRTHGEMAVLSARLNSILRLGGGWMIHCDAVRHEAPGYPPPGAFPDPVTAAIDAERRLQFDAEVNTEGYHYESDYYLALTYQPPLATEARARGFMFTDDRAEKPDHSPAERALKFFQDCLVAFEDVFTKTFKADRLRLDADGVMDELSGYCRLCVSGEDYPFRMPEIPTNLQYYIGTEPLVAGVAPKIGERHLRTLAIDGFPDKSYPGILGALDALRVSYRWNTRAILLDPQEALVRINRVRKKWNSRIRGWADVLLNKVGGRVNKDASDMEADAEEAFAVASSGKVHFCLYESTVILSDTDELRLDDCVREVRAAIRNLGFACRVEDINTVEAWRGSLPGDGNCNIHMPILHTLNLADMLPITSVWSGAQECPSSYMPRHSPPVMLAATDGATPFRVHMHVGDVGNWIVIGPPGAGKSTLIASLAAQWFRFPNARVLAFDKGASLFAITAAGGGSFYDVGGSEVQFCPLSNLDTSGDLAWAVQYLETLCLLQGQAITPGHRKSLSDALLLLRDSPSRTFTELVANLQDGDLRAALADYTLTGSLGNLLDADRDTVASARFTTYEMKALMEDHGEKAVAPVLLYLFRRLEQRLDGAPVLLVLDEAWVYLRHPIFRERIRDWLKTFRKYNVSIILATQNLSDIGKSPIGDVLLGNCPTKVLLPDPQADTPLLHDSFRDLLGLNDRQIGIVRDGMPKRDYYIVSHDGCRLISLGLGKVALSFAGVCGQEDIAAIKKLIAREGAGWPAEWLRSRGLADWAEYLQESAKAVSV